MVASAFLGLILVSQMFMQVVEPAPSVGGSAIVQPSSSSSGSTTNNVTNVFPAPTADEVIATEKQAAPVVLQSGLSSIDADGGQGMSDVFKLGLSFASIRKDVILLPVVQTLNQGMTHIVLASLGMVIAALALWGLIGPLVGSDSREAFDYLMRVPLWCLIALSSMQWFGLVLDFFTALAGMIATDGQAAFGPTLRSDFWSNVGLGLFAEFVGLFYLICLLLFVLQAFTNTAFLAFCAVVAPVFVFLKTTPWTSRWGDNWFRMVPATAADLLAMLCILVIGAAGFNMETADSGLATIALDLGLLMCLPLVRRLFGLERGSAGGRFFGAMLFTRAIRSLRAGSRTSAPVSAAVGVAVAPVSTSTPTRSPRWDNHTPGTAATFHPIILPGSRPV